MKIWILKKADILLHPFFVFVCNNCIYLPCGIKFFKIKFKYFFHKKTNKNAINMSLESSNMTTKIHPKIEQYLETVKDQISHVKLEGYLPADRIIDAFSRGEEHGENKFFENLKNGFMTKALQQFIYSNTIADILRENQYVIYSCYISPVQKKTIFVTDENNIVDDEFINIFYTVATDYEERFKKDLSERIRFSFISNDNIDEEELEFDNFINILSNG